MKYAFEPQSVWCGSEASYEYVLACYARAGEAKALAMDGLPPMWEQVGSTAVVNIQGPLVQGDAGIMRIFGITGYDNIRAAVAEAVANEDIKSIMLNVDSGGGQVAGVSDTAKFIAQAGAIKPISTYTSDMMASAAYWTGSTSKHITASDTATVGSIGVLIVHAEKSKMLAEMGITPTVVRAGEFKANTNPYEPLSDSGRATLQAQVDHMYAPFLSHVADMRGVSEQEADAKMAQGREFIGSQALDVGLIDKVGTYEDALKVAEQLGTKTFSSKMGANVRSSVARAGNVSNNPAQMTQGSNMTKPTLPTEIAPAAAAAAVEPAVPAVAAEPAAAESEIAAFLRAELQTAQAGAITAGVAALAASEKITALEAALPAFEAIVRLSVDHMAVALGGSGGTALSGAELLAKHQELQPTYEAKFRSGGVAATAPVESAPAKAKVGSHSMFAALAKSVPASTK